MTFYWGNKASVQFSCSVMSDSLQPHETQHARPPCPSPTPGVHPNPCPSSWWCHPTISSSVITFSSCPQSFPASGSFQMSQLFAWGGQSTGVSASTSVLSIYPCPIPILADGLRVCSLEFLAPFLIIHHSQKSGRDDVHREVSQQFSVNVSKPIDSHRLLEQEESEFT